MYDFTHFVEYYLRIYQSNELIIGGLESPIKMCDFLLDVNLRGRYVPGGYNEFQLKFLQQYVYPDLTIEQICETLKEQAPSLDWQEKILNFYRNLPEEDKEEFQQYTNYSSSSINSYLRDKKPETTRMNEIIYRGPSLEQDIIVYRIVTHFDDLEKDEFKSYGMLSTSLSLIFTLGNPSPGDSWKPDYREKDVILEISVEAGMNCLYFNNRYEWELLFPHNLTLKVNERTHLNIAGEEIRYYRLSIV